ncbi:hypothetical protein PHMEG_00037885, partial [Phytophthora megakarya]
MINTRVIQYGNESNNPPSLQEQSRASAVFVTPENATRLSINNVFLMETLRTDYLKGALNGLSRSDLEYVLGLPDNRFGRMAPYLDLVPGMPIQVMQNVATAKGVANGTLGSLAYVQFPRLVQDGSTSTVVQFPSQPPDYALIRVPRPTTVAILPGLDAELFPVFNATQAYAKTTIKLAPVPDGQPRSVTMRPQQFPFVCAVGSTVYKVQGETLQSMIVMDWKSTQSLVNKPQQTYLLVSRITTRKGLSALASMTEKLVEWSKPPEHALREEERLNDLSNATLARFQLPAATNVTDQCLDGNSSQP